jgi:chorismate-pyruvate lyase
MARSRRSARHRFLICVYLCITTLEPYLLLLSLRPDVVQGTLITFADAFPMPNERRKPRSLLYPMPNRKCLTFLTTRPRCTTYCFGLSADTVENYTVGDQQQQSTLQPFTSAWRTNSIDNNDNVPGSSTTSLGDIMSTGLMTPLTTKTVAQQYGITNPLDRMLLTANGNLQRLVSSYYDAPVAVVVDAQQQQQQYSSDSNTDISQGSTNTTSVAVWNRVVRLMVHNTTFCTATSTIQVHNDNCQRLVASGRVGLGQLFRYLNVLPEFALLGAGIGEATGTGLWREYTLHCPELTCTIREEFCEKVWSIEPALNDL